MQNDSENKIVNFKSFQENSLMINILKGVAIAYALTVIVFIAYALLLTYTEISEKHILGVVTVTAIVAVIIAGYDSAKSADSKGWLWGMTAGLIYAVIAVIIGVVSSKGNIKIEFSTIAMMVMSIAGGGLGGMIGINRKKDKKYKK